MKTRHQDNYFKEKKQQKIEQKNQNKTKEIILAIGQNESENKIVKQIREDKSV